MKFNSSTQKKTYYSAMKKIFKAVAFDVDGTLTPFCRFAIPDHLTEALAKIPIETPLAICTGRPVEFIHFRLEQIFNVSKNPNAEKKRWFIFSDNGGAGYIYDDKKEDYKQIFEIKWPNKKVNKDDLAAQIKIKIGWWVNLAIRKYTVVIVFPRTFYLWPRFVKFLSKKVHFRLEKMLKELDLSEVLSIQDSGLGNLVIPVESGKGHAMQRWAKHLNIDLKDIICIGDRPDKGGNDEAFLSGENGTAFTVGCRTKNTFPLPIFDTKKQRLKGPTGTEEIIRQLFL